MNVKKKQEYLIIVGLLVLIFPFFALLFFVHPQGDDYCFLEQLNNYNNLEFVKNMYYHWTGRYFSMFLASLDPMKYSLNIYRLFLFLFQIIFLSSIFLFIKSVVISNVKYTSIIIATLIFYLIYANLSISIFELFYWYPSVSAYLLGLSLLLIFISIYFFYKRKSLSIYSFLTLSTILSFILIGLTEIFIIPIFIFISSIIYADLKTKAFNYMVILLLIIILSTVVIFAPGNFVRASLFESHSISIALVNAIKSLILALGYIIKNPTFIVLSLAFYIFLNSKNSNYFIFNFQKINLLKFYLVSILIFLLWLLPITYSLGNIPPGRVLNILESFIIIAWIFGIIVLSSKNKLTLIYKTSKKLQNILILLSILFLFSGVFVTNNYSFSKGDKSSIYLDGNILLATYELMYYATIYDHEIQKRTTRYHSNNNDSLILPSLSYYPKTLTFYYIEPSKYYNQWIQCCESQYYNLDSIYIEPRKEE